MKVTDYYPIFYTKDIDAEAKRYTDVLGFTVLHRPKLESLEYAVLENEKKRRIDLVRSFFPADNFSEGYFGMRANVDNFDEAVAWFETQGYEMVGTSHETESAVTALMKKGEDNFVVIFHHKK